MIPYTFHRSGVDKDHDGKINKTEFCSAMSMIRQAQTQQSNLLNSSLPASAVSAYGGEGRSIIMIDLAYIISHCSCLASLAPPSSLPLALEHRGLLAAIPHPLLQPAVVQ